MTTFVDQVVLHVAAGDGGHGCASIHREKFKPLGGPDGGDGGSGGDVVLVVDPAVSSLLDYHFSPHRKASSGRPGQGSHRNGADGDTVVLPVPDGTTVTGPDGELLADLVGAGTRFVIARGGRGGLGNSALASNRRKAPGFALLGEPGDAGDITLTLRTVADVALVGYPSAGKSSLVSVLSAAKPKIADYPFTTLVPNLGVVTVGGTVFTVADVPGLIPGASSGKGLGLEFLRHVERCTVLVHVLDCGTLEPGRDPVSDLEVIEAEIAAYDARTGAGLGERPRIVALNKTDLADGRELAELVTPLLEERGLQVLPVSAVDRSGLRALGYALAEMVTAARQALSDPEPTRIVLRPRAVDEIDFTLRQLDHDGEAGFEVVGAKPRRWVAQTDFANDEAVGYLADRLARLGVEAALVKAGVSPGDPVTVGGVTFDWVPSAVAGLDEDLVLGRRGEDQRLDRSGRAGASDRLAAKRGRRGARADADDDLVAGPVATALDDGDDIDDIDDLVNIDDLDRADDGDDGTDGVR